MDDVSDAPDHPSWNFSYAYMSDSTHNATYARYTFAAGQHDEVCKGVIGAPSLGRPCTVIHTTNANWMYLSWPQDNFCCKCTQKIGAVRSDWLRDGGATYSGRTSKDADNKAFGPDSAAATADGWLKMGASDNHYYCTPDAAQRPVRYMEHKNGKLKQWDFLGSTFNDTSSAWAKSGPPAALFAPPPSCEKRCVSFACSL
eukprot:g2075.t1